MVPPAGICRDCSATNATTVPGDTGARCDIHPELRGPDCRLYLHPAHPQSTASAAWTYRTSGSCAGARLRHPGAAADIRALVGDVANGATALGRPDRNLPGWITDHDRPGACARAAGAIGGSNTAATLRCSLRRSDRA